MKWVQQVVGCMAAARLASVPFACHVHGHVDGQGTLFVAFLLRVVCADRHQGGLCVLTGTWAGINACKQHGGPYLKHVCGPYRRPGATCQGDTSSA